MIVILERLSIPSILLANLKLPTIGIEELSWLEETFFLNNAVLWRFAILSNEADQHQKLVHKAFFTEQRITRKLQSRDTLMYSRVRL